MKLRVRSALPGRARWDVDVLLDRPAYAKRVEKQLLADPAIFLVVANPITGRLLVHHLKTLAQASVEALLRLALERAALDRSAAVDMPTADWFDAARGDEPAFAPLRRLLTRVGRVRRLMQYAVAASTLQKIFNMGQPLLIGLVIDVVVRGPSPILLVFGFRSASGQLVLLAILNVAVWILEAIFEYLQRVLWRNVAQKVQHQLRVDAYAHLQTLDIAFSEKVRSGRLLSLLHDDVNQLEMFLSNGIDQFIRVVVTLGTVTSVFFWFAPTAGVALLLLMPPLFLFAYDFQRRISVRYSAVRVDTALIADRLAINLGGLSTILGFTAEEHETQQVRTAGERYMGTNFRAILLSAGFMPIVRMVVLVGFSTTLVVGGRLVLARRLPIGAYSAMISLTQRLLWTMIYMEDALDDYQRAMAALRRVLKLLDQRPTIVSGAEPLRLGRGGVEITFDRVTFGYEPGTVVVRDLSLRIEAGKTTAIVGSTGSGKTTLVKLLLRFYDVERGGAIRVDGVDIRSLGLGALRSAIGLVSQDIVLFHGTIRENIAYGVRAPDQARVIEAATIAEAHGFITDLPRGYDTVVGERGLSLSGGQRQRLAIARAMYRDPEVLVFDEATSAVDNDTELVIQRSLEQIAVGRTTVLIAHRLSTVRRAHRILVLERGVVTQQGRHDELVAIDGLYRHLWSVQTGSVTEPRQAR